ncbi:hypothetical protein [Actinomadura luteofluorescens]|uniref:hypothetical protein n=1 Tax=Actinomadura luteofluorescens TaxID=46163 RepID=UPI003D8C9C1F
MEFSESDRDFERLIRAMAAEEMRACPPASVEEHAALKRFRRRMRAHRAAERRARATRLAAALRALPPRLLFSGAGPRLAFVIVVVVLLTGVIAVLSLASPSGGHTGKPGMAAREPTRGRQEPSTPAMRPTGARKSTVETSLSGQMIVDGAGMGHPVIPSPRPSTMSAADPAAGTWIVMGTAIPHTREILLMTKPGPVEVTATVSGWNTLKPCEWTVSAGPSRSKRKPATTEPTRVTFAVPAPASKITLGVKHDSSGPDTGAEGCVMANILVKARPSQSSPSDPTNKSDGRGRSDRPRRRTKGPTVTTTQTPTPAPSATRTVDPPSTPPATETPGSAPVSPSTSP